MEDVLYLLLVAAVMVGGVISSAIKKKKEKEAAARKAAQNTSVGTAEPERKFVRKSLSEVLEELANQQNQAHEPESTEVQDDYMASREESERAAERLREMTYVSTENTPRRIHRSDVMQEEPVEAGAQNGMKDILGGEFDLRRAVIESEILKPKFEQY